MKNLECPKCHTAPKKDFIFNYPKENSTPTPPTPPPLPPPPAPLLPIKFKKLDPEAVPPLRGTAGAAGYDLTAISVTYDHDKYLLECGTGIAVEIPPGHVGLLFPRSSIYKTGLVLSNSVGVIDSDYRGEIKFKFYVEWPGRQSYHVGDRVGQLVIMPIPQVDYIEAGELSSTERGEGGYGSTGK